MSVGVTVACTIDVLRREELKVPLRPDIIARWFSYVQSLGDASGGVNFCSTTLQGIENLYGQKTLWDIQFINKWYSGAAVVATEVLWSVQSQDLSNGLNLILKFTDVAPAYYYTRDDFVLPAQIRGFKFGFPYKGGAGAAITQTLTPNTNGNILHFLCGGYIYDMAYL